MENQDESISCSSRPSNAISSEGIATITDRAKTRKMFLKAHRSILLSFGDEVLREVGEKESVIDVWEKLQSIFLKRSLANRQILKKKLFRFQMKE